MWMVKRKREKWGNFKNISVKECKRQKKPWPIILNFLEKIRRGENNSNTISVYVSIFVSVKKGSPRGGRGNHEAFEERT